MNLVNNNLIYKSKRTDRETFILICYENNPTKLIKVNFNDKGEFVYLNDILKQHDLLFSKYKLFKDIPMDAVDYLLQVNKNDEINNRSQVLFTYNNGEMFFLFEDFYSLKEKESLTNGVVDFISFQVFSKNNTEAVVLNSLVIHEALKISKKKSCIQNAKSLLKKLLADAIDPIAMSSENFEKEFYIPSCINYHWTLLKVNLTLKDDSLSLYCTIYDSNTASDVGSSGGDEKKRVFKKYLKVIFNEIIEMKNLNCTIGTIQLELLECPQQESFTNDCGIYVLSFLELLLENKKVDEFNGDTAAYRLKLKNIVKEHVNHEISLPQI